MRPARLGALGAALALLLAGAPSKALAQWLPLPPTRPSGQTVTPAYEGWYENPDGTLTLSFGYFNRNADQVLEIPLGDDNFIEPAEFNGDQPTIFYARRHWGVFGIRVPGDFDGRIEWTLKVNGQTFMVPGHTKPEWKIDALEGEAGDLNTPPVLSFSPGGPEGAGPGGIEGPELTGKVGQPLTVNVWAKDDGRGAGTRTVPVSLTWLKHQGPGDVTFAPDTARVDLSGGEMTTMATFTLPGNYVLRVRANDASGVSGAGHAQCCWSNGFVKVRVTR